MAYDEAIAERIRDLLADEPELTERKMFGGLAFLVRGSMAVTASSRGGIMVRVDPAESAKLIETTAAIPMEMKGRDLGGWVRVPAEHVRTKRQLATWVRRGVAAAAAAPPKRARTRAT